MDEQMTERKDGKGEGGGGGGGGVVDEEKM